MARGSPSGSAGSRGCYRLHPTVGANPSHRPPFFLPRSIERLALPVSDLRARNDAHGRQPRLLAYGIPIIPDRPSNLRRKDKYPPPHAGTPSRGSEAPRGRPAQRGKVGSFSRCACITHIASPVISDAGENDWLKDQAENDCGNALGRGRRAFWPPCFAEIITVRSPPNREWEAKAADIPAPAPVSELVPVRPPLHVHDDPPQCGTASSMRETHAGDVPSPDTAMRSTTPSRRGGLEEAPPNGDRDRWPQLRM